MCKAKTGFEEKKGENEFICSISSKTLREKLERKLRKKRKEGRRRRERRRRKGRRNR